MATKFDRLRSTKRDTTSIQEGAQTYNYNLRKKLKPVEDSSTKECSQMLERKGNLDENITENASNSRWQTPSLNFPPLSQEKLKKIYGQNKDRNITLEFEDSEESEEDDGLTEEELQQTEGYMLTMKALDAMFGKPKPNT